MSVAFLRSESGGQVKMTFTGNISSLGYLTPEEAKLNAIVRAKGGASLHSWSFGVSVKCADKDQPLTPLTHDVPNDLAQNIFTNVSTVGIGETGRAEFPRGEGSAVQLMGKPHRADMPPRINAITGFIMGHVGRARFRRFQRRRHDRHDHAQLQYRRFAPLRYRQQSNYELLVPRTIGLDCRFAGVAPIHAPGAPISCCAASTLVNSRCTTSPAIT
jgi:hypothetical protein